MYKKDLMDMANRFYPDGHLSQYYDDKGDFMDNPDGGDTLAKFIVLELDNLFGVGEHYRGEADAEVLREASQLIHTAIGDLLSVLAGFDGIINWRGLTAATA